MFGVRARKAVCRVKQGGHSERVGESRWLEERENSDQRRRDPGAKNRDYRLEYLRARVLRRLRGARVSRPLRRWRSATLGEAAEGRLRFQRINFGLSAAIT